MTRRAHPLVVPSLLALAALAACSGPRTLPGDDAPTIASLAQREFVLPADPGLKVTEEQTIAAYREFLATAPTLAPDAPQRQEAMRRLGDLEMDRADRVAADGAGSEPDYQAAITRYDAFLKAFPNDPHNDRVLYQLARAQEQGGQLEAALKTLGTLVTTHPDTGHAAEAQFRRGELLFALRDWRQAEAAYATVLRQPERTPFHERALYMQGWSLFKQNRLEDAVGAFFGVLDLKLGTLDDSQREETQLSSIASLSRADRELVEDTFRVTSISLAGLQGAESVASSITTPVREGYQFRVYQQLGELYIRQDRIKDAADTFALFVRRQPLHAQAPLLQARVIEIYEKNGFETLALQAKTDHVVRYGADSEFRRANPAGWARAQPLVKTHLAQLATHHHALAQKSHAAADVQEAARWYRALLTAFPDDAQAPHSRFLLAELLFEDRRWAEAAVEFETVAYATPVGGDTAGSANASNASNAGYSALLAYAALDKDTSDPTQRAALQRQSIASAQRFAKAFGADARAGAVLVRSAEQLFSLGDGDAASQTAQQALALNPPPEPTLRRTAWTVVAHRAFEQQQYADAERAYGEVLALGDGLGDKRSPARDATVERLAASIYKQGEASRSSGDARAAVGHFERIAALGALPAGSAVRASAGFDAAVALIGLKDWEPAASALEDFRRQHPGHPLQAEVAPKLALAYLELKRPAQAAAEFQRVASQAGTPELARSALWQAAELQQQAAASAPPRSPLLADAIKAYERYLQQNPQPVEQAVEARWRLAELNRQDAQAARATVWVREVQQADAAAGDARTPRTRTLGGQATLLLTEPLQDAYRKVALVEPLARNLKLKKAKLEELLRAYAAAAEYGIAEVSTAATFHSGATYQDFGRALMTSARPKKLSKAELEQYNVLLEEQAFPFEEKAIALHEGNARRAASGLYDPWVQKSFDALATLKPVRYGKVERADASLPTDGASIDAALKTNPRQPRLLNQHGIALRRAGRFADAREAYQQAMALDPTAAAPVVNLAILHDLYLSEPALALPLYERAVLLVNALVNAQAPAEAATLNRWVAEIKTRKPEAVATNTAPTSVTTSVTNSATTSATTSGTKTAAVAAATSKDKP